ncbi:MAG: hypothetical protein KGJ89_01890 [Patescibacteria group bacterium]|nr:hypothetical protein [Patescibacteria group bacterium]MDE2015629.1 hypothetical protein [Patescibacteria group bacterium]MDE2226686.1 hypothetical protein [Patescibacteria group bacterium]
MLNERTSEILEALVQDFINTGEPISSGWLYDHYDFGIKPAMIRLELEQLFNDGFLEQPHHAAGRIPSNKGYDFFAKKVLAEEDGSTGAFEQSLRNFLGNGNWPDLVGEMSAGLKLLSVANSAAEHGSFKEGLDNLIENLEWESPEELKSVVKDFVEIDERLNHLGKEIFNLNSPSVFIGKKSPVTKSECLSVVMGSYDSGKGKVALFAIGPKRMNYKKTLKTFKNLKNGRNNKK